MGKDETSDSSQENLTYYLYLTYILNYIAFSDMGKKTSLSIFQAVHKKQACVENVNLLK